MSEMCPVQMNVWRLDLYFFSRELRAEEKLIQSLKCRNQEKMLKDLETSVITGC